MSEVNSPTSSGLASPAPPKLTQQWDSDAIRSPDDDNYYDTRSPLLVRENETARLPNKFNFIAINEEIGFNNYLTDPKGRMVITKTKKLTEGASTLIVIKGDFENTITSFTESEPIGAKRNCEFIVSTNEKIYFYTIGGYMKVYADYFDEPDDISEPEQELEIDSDALEDDSFYIY